MHRLHEVERARAVAERALEVGGEVPEVRQLQRERLGAGVEPGRVRRQALHRARDGEGVLGAVLGRRGEGGRALAVGCLAGTARGRAREHARRDGAVVDAHERLGARADEPVDRVDPRVGVVLGEAVDDRPQAVLLVQLADELAGEHDLLELAGVDAAHRLRDGRLVPVGRHGAGRERHPRHAALRRRLGDLEGERRGGIRGIRRRRGIRWIGVVVDRGERDAGDPCAPVAAAEHELGHHEHARRRGVVGERERAERHEARAGQADAVVDVGGGRDRRPRGGGVGDAARSARLDAQRLAEADDALTASHPEQRMPRVGARDQRRELIDGFGADDEPRGGDARRRGIRLGHRTSLRPAA